MAKKTEADDGRKLQEIKTRITQIRTSFTHVKAMNQALVDLYWVGDPANDQNEPIPGLEKADIDEDDVRWTRSPSSRNEVVGLHRLVKTSSPHFSVKCDDNNWADKMEKFLDTCWKANNEGRRAKVESDLFLSAILSSDANLSVDIIQDLLSSDDLPAVRKSRLKEKQKRGLFKFNVDPFLTTYPIYGDEGISEYLVDYQMNGLRIKEKWGVGGLDANRLYTVSDYYNLEYRALLVDSVSEPIKFGKHGVDEIPRFSATADGTDLFPEEHRKRQPFLFSKWKSGLAEREDELLTIIFTSAYSRGVGPLAMVDPQSISSDGKLKVRYAGLFRYVLAKGLFADDHAYDANLIKLKEMIDQMGQESTINSQTLGENIQPGTPYSGYAMASRTGQITIVSITEAVQQVIKSAALYCLKMYKDGKAGTWPDLKPADIPDKFDMEVTLTVDLPQDSLRTAQVVDNLLKSGVPLSNSFIHDLLQIHDSDAMVFEWLTDQATVSAFRQDLPALVAKMLAILNPPVPTDTSGGASTPPGSEAPPTPGAPSMERPMMPGGPAAARAGAEATPAEQPISRPAGPPTGG